MTIYDFMSNSPWLTFFLALFVLMAVEITLKYCINRPLRSRNIKLHGWPPEHCDADGDFKEVDKSSE